MYGLIIGLIELLLFFTVAFGFKKYTSFLKTVDNVSYYWLSMTILTGIWELSYIVNNAESVTYSGYLLTNHEHVWTNQYDLSYLLPNKLSTIFYAEYGAYADREYMFTRDSWSKIIEGSHAILCGIFSAAALALKDRCYLNKYNLALGIAMGSQAMNSILYMTQYIIQTQEINSINYNRPAFPTGTLLYKRPFMYVNVFWILMPSWVLCKHFLKSTV